MKCCLIWLHYIICIQNETNKKKCILSVLVTNLISSSSLSPPSSLNWGLRKIKWNETNNGICCLDFVLLFFFLLLALKLIYCEHFATCNFVCVTVVFFFSFSTFIWGAHFFFYYCKIGLCDLSLLFHVFHQQKQNKKNIRMKTTSSQCVFVLFCFLFGSIMKSRRYISVCGCYLNIFFVSL